ncbi:MAG: GDP-mannose 4,6-dehydratase [Oligoflexia bacterium]|nr:GDP-mannose 4,6-dehydratase [Oligoflexia bacterium]
MKKKLLITGAGGFIGSHLVDKCVNDGYQVRAFVHYNSRNSWGWLEGSSLLNKIEIQLGDIRDFDSVYAALDGCDGVMHLAALIGIPYSYVSPLAYIRTNVEGTYNVLQAAKLLKLEDIIITSTSETYGSAQTVPIDENHPLVGQSPYAATKISADQLGISFYRSFGLPVKIARPFNTFGPRQSARAVIPTIITQILSGSNKVKLGNISPTRDLTYVKDTAAGFLAILNEKKLAGEVINIGMGTEISVEDLAYKIAELMGKKISVEEDGSRVRPDKSEVNRLVCNANKLKEHTNWNPKYDLNSGLKETIEFLTANLELYKPSIYSV